MLLKLWDRGGIYLQLEECWNRILGQLPPDDESRWRCVWVDGENDYWITRRKIVQAKEAVTTLNVSLQLLSTYVFHNDVNLVSG